MEQEQGICPVCSSENLEYGAIDVTDVGVFYPVTCKDCGANFEEHYDLTFVGHYKINNTMEVK